MWYVKFYIKLILLMIATGMIAIFVNLTFVIPALYYAPASLWWLQENSKQVLIDSMDPPQEAIDKKARGEIPWIMKRRGD